MENYDKEELDYLGFYNVTRIHIPLLSIFFVKNVE